MRPVITFLEEKFNYFNTLCFEGKLPRVDFRLSRARTFGGKLSYNVERGLFRSKIRKPVISISTLYDRPQHEVEDILLHEMIHLYILSNNIKDSSSHGPAFRSVMDRLNRQYGRHITVSLHHDETLQQQDTRLRRHLVCVSRLRNGNTGITIATHTSVFELWRALEASPLVSESKWYVTTDPYFNRYPRSRTLKIYRADTAELATHLAGAHDLCNDGKTIKVKY